MAIKVGINGFGRIGRNVFRAALGSNLCRCTGYNQMYEAIRSAIAAERKAEDVESAQ